MSRLIITILSAGVVTLVSASCVEAQDDDRLAKFVPTELWACNYNEGQGPDDLDVVAGNWNAYMDENEADTYQAWTLTPQYFTDEQDFDLLWLGAWKDGNAMGQGRDNYRATGGAIMAEFGKVLDCGAHVGFVSRAFKLPPDYDAGPPNTGVITFTDCARETLDFKLLGVHANYASLGADLERLGNGELWRKRMELLDDQFDCDVSRVYDARLRRAAQIR
jgi:hypothetical protein